MSRVMFFSIPAAGHTNPTLAVVAELVARGHEVRYWSFEQFRERIEATGATFVSCDTYLPPASDRRVDRMRTSATEMTLADVEITLAIAQDASADILAWEPDAIVADSVCFWGKLLARRHGVPYVCSTTTFAFNEASAGYMRSDAREVTDLLLGSLKIRRAVRRLRKAGFEVAGILDLVRNDENTNTIVYTSRTLQPAGETFSDHYCFVGSTPRAAQDIPQKGDRPLVYVSLGTILNQGAGLFSACAEALGQMDVDAIMALGETDPALLEQLPANVRTEGLVDQVGVLTVADAFVTHCGMNSASEALYLGVPMVLCPQNAEERAVARRVAEVGAGIEPERLDPARLRVALEALLSQDQWHEAAQAASADLRSCGGAPAAADFIERCMDQAV